RLELALELVDRRTERPLAGVVQRRDRLEEPGEFPALPPKYADPFGGERRRVERGDAREAPPQRLEFGVLVARNGHDFDGRGGCGGGGGAPRGERHDSTA